MNCPICQKPVKDPNAGEPLPAHFPFCSERCKLIDLGRWLDGKYQVPGADGEDDPPPPVSPAPSNKPR